MDFWTSDGSMTIRYKRIRLSVPSCVVEECDLQPKGLFAEGKRMSMVRHTYRGKREFALPTRDGLSISVHRSHEVEIWYPGEWYWVTIWLDESGMTVGTKVEFCLPLEASPGLARHTSLELSIFVSSDGWVKIIDEEKFINLIATGYITPRQADKVRETFFRLMSEIEDERFLSEILRILDRTSSDPPPCTDPSWEETVCEYPIGPQTLVDQVVYRWGLSGRNHYEAANDLFAKGDHKGAETLYRRAIALEPSNCSYRFALACLYLNTDRMDDAQAQFFMALSSKREVFPTYLAWSHVNLGDILLARGKTIDAEAHYRQALSFGRSSTSKGAYTGLGKIAVASKGRRQLYHMAAQRLDVELDGSSNTPPSTVAAALEAASDEDTQTRNKKKLLYMLPTPAGYRCILEQPDSDDLVEVML